MIDLWLPPKPAIIRPAPDIKRASFMPGMFPAGAIAAAAPPLPTLGFVGLSHNDTQQTTYTFTGVNIGAADPTRRVLAVFQWGDTTSQKTLSSATMDGSAISAHNIVAGGTTAGSGAILSRLKAAGTTADYTFTLSGAAASMKASLAIFRALNETVATPNATASDNTPSGLVLNTTIAVPANGWVLACGCFFGSGAPTNYTWTGLTEAYEERRGGPASTGLTRSGGAIAQLLAANAAYPFQYSPDQGSTGANGYLNAISWG